MKRRKISWSVFLCLVLFAALPVTGDAATVNVDCGVGGTIQTSVNAAAPGTIIAVSGLCNENVVIKDSTALITIDGGGTAVLTGKSAAKNTIDVRGRGIVIKRLTIKGGYNGVQVHSGGTATMDSNIIQNAKSHGISVAGGSFAVIVNNKIRNNAFNGIVVTENASSHIGFASFQDAAAKPNIITNNGNRGINVQRSASAVVIGNTISANLEDGIRVQRAAHADIAGNIINGNQGSGIHVVENSGVNLGGTGNNLPAFFNLPNSTTIENGLFGIACNFGAYAAGQLGSLSGNSGVKDAAGCFDGLF